MEKLEINILPKFIDEAATPVAKSVGNTVSGIWDLAFGNHVSLWLKKQEYKQQQNYKDFVEKVNSKIENIPTENIKEPEMNILGPAIDASKYYIDSEALRQMFANLISASVDSSKTDNLHPSFVEIVKQLSPLDAMNIGLFKSRQQLPIANYLFRKKDRSYIPLDRNIFLENKTVSNLASIATSISNLERLGIINISYATLLQPEEIYNDFYKTEPFLSHQNMLNATLQTSGDSNTITVSPKSFLEIEKVDVQKGIISITPYGSSFIKICLV